MNKTDIDSISSDDDSLAEIFADVTPRSKPRTEAEERAFVLLDSQWRELTKRRQKRNRIMSWSIAASVVIAVSVAYNWIGFVQETTVEPVADVARMAGERIYVNESIVGNAPGGLSAFQSGDELKTGPDSRLSLKWNSGGSLRIDQNSEVRFVSPDVIRLASGSIYFDSHPYDREDNESPAFSVETAAGRLSHVGTQFMASADGEDITLGVREGQVLIDGPRFNFLAQSGDRLIIDAGGLQEKQLLATYDDAWRWAEDIAPSFNPNGRTVQEMVNWISRETGRPFHYASTSAESSAIDTRLIGLDDLNPIQALRTMPFATDLIYEIVNEEIVIRLDDEQP